MEETPSADVASHIAEAPEEGPHASPSYNELQFEFAKMDYQRLALQEQQLMNKRPELWPKFFAILYIPSGFSGIIGLKGGIFLFALVPLFLACLSIEVKHDEQVLRYDVRRGMKLLAAGWGYANIEKTTYAKKDRSRWWGNYYKLGRAVAFLCTEGIVLAFVSWYLWTSGEILLAIICAIVNVVLTVFTAWCHR